MKTEKTFYYCDLCKAEIKEPKLGSFKNYSFREVVWEPISGIYGLMRGICFKVFWFEMAFGKSYTELCKDCADAFTKTMEERRKLAPTK